MHQHVSVQTQFGSVLDHIDVCRRMPPSAQGLTSKLEKHTGSAARVCHTGKLPSNGNHPVERQPSYNGIGCGLDQLAHFLLLKLVADHHHDHRPS